MPVRFRTLISSSAGNCTKISCGGATLLVDCGFRSQKACNEALDQIRGEVGVLVSHSHGDHLNYAGLKALAKRGVEVRAHQLVMEQVWEKIPSLSWGQQPRLEPFGDGAFEMLGFRVLPFRVQHAPQVPNFGFVIDCLEAGRRIVVCTDFYEPRPIREHLVNADLIYVESNHDLELLRLRPNPASRWHLSNPKAAALLSSVLPACANVPQAIVLGHLSCERNEKDLAIATVRQELQRAEVKVTSSLTAAPPYTPSPELVID